MNHLLKVVQAENASSKPQNRTPDLYCRTLQDFYEASKEDRKALRECSVGADKILETFVYKLKQETLKSGEETAAAIVSKAMKNAYSKLQLAKTIDEQKEEKVDTGTGLQLPPKRISYPHSVSKKFVSYLPGAMDVVDRGISLKGLRTILQEYLKNEDGFEAFKANHPEVGQHIRCPGENLTHMLVKPETRICECYIELLYGIFKRSAKNAETEEKVKFIKKESDETLGKVNVFVSHTWAYNFKTLVDSVQQWENNWEKANGKKHETFYYFVDYFAVNQHNQEGDLLKLHEAVQNSKVTCLVLNPWDEPIPLYRCWCIYEIAKTELFPSTRLNVAFPPDEVKRFKKLFFDETGMNVREIPRVIENVDSQRAKASWPPDEKKIKEDIRNNLGGFQRVNELCIRNLRKGLIEQACEFADAEVRGDYYNENSDKVAYIKAYWVLKNVGTFLRHQGKFEKSIKYLKDAMSIMEGYYAGDLEEKDEEKVASKWFEQSYNKICYGLAQKIKNVDERKTQMENFLKLLNSLANSLTDLQQYNEAEAIYSKTLKWRSELLNWSHKDTRMTQFNYGVCLIHQKQFKNAEEILNDVFNFWDESKKYRYWALFNIADIKSRNFQQDEAEKCFSNACHGLRNIVKVEERDRFFLLANVLWAQHHLRWADQAEVAMQRKMLKKALDKATQAYNNFCMNSDPSHPDTRLAARTKRRIELRLSPEIREREEEKRHELIKESYDRKWSAPTNESDNQKNIIRVMQWNLLADKLAYPDFKKGGFGCSFKQLNWNEYRKDRILAEIIKYKPDVLVLVELDHYEDIRFVLQEDFRYESIWKKKNKNFYTDGTGIFWRKDRFESGKVYKQPLMKSLGLSKEADQVFVAVELSSREDKGENFVKFVLGGCHLKSTKKSKGEQIRLDQCKQVMTILDKEFNGLPAIIGADMNAEAKTAHYEALAYPFFIDSGMVSAYQSVLGREPDYTSWKFRIDEENSISSDKKKKETVKEWKYTIDFIFHSKELKTLNILNVPEEKEIDDAYGDRNKPDEGDIAFARRRCLLPNKRCPSDHLPILAEISLPSEHSRQSATTEYVN